ncbi:MAG: hypothetical protein GY805_37935, partial [Chloroflexi bacterium]|nr:hypothetical protein [Chloroflexota bacterium]
AVWLTFLPFGSPFDLMDRLLRESASYPGFSLATLLLLIAGWLKQSLSFDLVANLFRIPFGLLILWLLWRGWNGRSPLKAATDTLFAYSLQALSFRLWYSTWPFLWLLLEEESPNTPPSYRLRAGFYFLLTTQFSVLIYGHLRTYAFGGNQIAAHLIGIPFVFFLPFLLAYIKKS